MRFDVVFAAKTVVYRCSRKGGDVMITDENIIELFFARSEQGIRELDIKYGKDFHNLSYHIVGSRQDAEECVNDAYLGAWNAIPPARPNPLLILYLLKSFGTFH